MSDSMGTSADGEAARGTIMVCLAEHRQYAG